MQIAYKPELPGRLSQEQLEDAARYMTEDGRPWEGYPGIEPGDRAYMTPGELRERTTAEVIERKGTLETIWWVELPDGHQEAVSPNRQGLLRPEVADTLLSPPLDDPIVTGDGRKVAPKAFNESLELGYRIFDTQGRRIPAKDLGRVAQLFGLHTLGDDGAKRPLGIPFGIGGMAEYGLTPVSDAVVLSQTSDGIAVLASGRPVAEDSLASPVWSTIGTFGNKADIRNGVYSPEAAAIRGVMHEAGVSVEGLACVVLAKDHPVSGPSTLHVGLETTPAVFVHPYDKSVKVEQHIPTGNDVQGTRWLNYEQLVATHRDMAAAWEASGRSPDLPRELLWKTTGSYMQNGVNVFRALVKNWG